MNPVSLFDPQQILSREDDSLSTVVPFNKAGNLILLKGIVDGVEGNFILDTGAPHLVLNLVYFRHYPTTVVADETHTGVTGAAQLIHKTQVRSFTMGGLSYPRLDADLVDLGHIENSKGVKILGLIGLELLQHCEMIIDYEQNLIYFHRVGRKEGTKYNSRHLADNMAYSTHQLEIKGQQIIATAQMGNRKLKFVLDSGAETNILDSRLPESVFENVAIIGRMTIRGTGNKAVEALRGDASHITIGTEAIDRLPVLVANLEHTCFAQNMGVNGVLGFTFLPLRKIGFNFVTRKMYLWK